MIFIETSIFTKIVGRYLTEKEFWRLQNYLLQMPEAGKMIRETGGVRKLRWAVSGKGKSGGLRIIHYWKKRNEEIWLLTLYSKGEQETIPNHILRQIAAEIKNA